MIGMGIRYALSAALEVLPHTRARDDGGQHDVARAGGRRLHGGAQVVTSRSSKGTSVPCHGQNVTLNPSEKLNPAGPPVGSRYQYWKFQVLKAAICPGPELTGGAA